MSTVDLPATGFGPASAARWCPLSLTLGPMARMLNFEIADDPVYEGFELQWFDDDEHGTGMLAFMSRRADRRVDYYPQRGLRLDRAGYHIGGGTGAWTETDFEVARLEIAEDGVAAEVRFTDVDGRLIEVRVDERDGRPRRRAHLLAPVSSGIDEPEALLLVWMSGFGLVHATGKAPQIRIDGRDAATGRLPGARLHRRHLIKYAGPLCAVEVNRAHDGPLPASGPGQRVELEADRSRVAAITAERGGHSARLELEPGLPVVGALEDGRAEEGCWHVTIDRARLTGGTWRAARTGERVELGMDVTERWRPPERLPLLMRVVTTVMPVFRRWPTTYRWRADVRLGVSPAMTAGWSRTSTDGGKAYRRATGS